MTPAEIGLLGVLAASPHPLPTGTVGQRYWSRLPSRDGLPRPQGRFPQAYARPAGRVLRALRAAGLVSMASRGDWYEGWVITLAGRRALDAAKDGGKEPR